MTTLTRIGPNDRVFVPWVEPGKGIAMTDRSNVSDGDKRRKRFHVSTESEAADQLRNGMHLWMVPEDSPNEREVLITPNSIEGWR